MNRSVLRRNSAPSSTSVPSTWRYSSNRPGSHAPTMMHELNRLLQTLCDAEIEFVVVGGFAAMLHGSSMLTRDLDICAVLTDSSIARLRTALASFHPTHRHNPERLSFLDNPQPGVSLKN